MSQSGKPSSIHEARMNAIVSDIETELKLWHENHMDPTKINFDLFQIDSLVDTVVAWIQKDMTQQEKDDFHYLWKTTTLANLTSFREMFAERIKKQREAEILERIKKGERIH